MERNPSTAVFTDRLTWGTVVAGAAAVLYKTTASQQQTVTGSGIATVAALATDGALGGVGLNASTGMVLVMVYAMYRMYLIPTRIRSKSYHDPRHPRFKAMRRKFFPPGFPNGWHCVCNATDLEGGNVHSISALGTHLVAFRGEDGVVGVLDAFCPHLGAHLGSGGVVVGNAIRCPFHSWEFAASGRCTHIPYSKTRDNIVPERAQTKAYEVREILERVFIWFDAEGRSPQWELKCHLDLAEGVASGEWYLGASRSLEFDMHHCEMHMNSADPFHFQTLHAPLPLPILEHVITGMHTIKQFYRQGVVRGKVVDRDVLCSITEQTTGLFLFGQKWLPVPFSATAAGTVETGVTFEGPNTVHFMVSTPFGKLRQMKTILPVEPFKQYVESRWYAERGVPRFIVAFFSVLGARALEQDREVWANKIYREKPMLVAGDGPFPAFMRWNSQFYSESSAEVGRHTLEW